MPQILGRCAHVDQSRGGTIQRDSKVYQKAPSKTWMRWKAGVSLPGSERESRWVSEPVVDHYTKSVLEIKSRGRGYTGCPVIRSSTRRNMPNQSRIFSLEFPEKSNFQVLHRKLSKQLFNIFFSWVLFEPRYWYNPIFFIKFSHRIIW